MANYRRLSWGAGPITSEKLNAMVENTDFLYERMMRGNWTMFGIQKETNLRMQGIVMMVPEQINNVSRFVNAYWPKPFQPGCSPIIVHGHYFTEKIIVSVGIRNINGGVFPDHAGFRMEAYAGDAGYGSEWAGTHWFPVLGFGW